MSGPLGRPSGAHGELISPQACETSRMRAQEPPHLAPSPESCETRSPTPPRTPPPPPMLTPTHSGADGRCPSDAYVAAARVGCRPAGGWRAVFLGGGPSFAPAVVRVRPRENPRSRMPPDEHGWRGSLFLVVLPAVSAPAFVLPGCRCSFPRVIEERRGGWGGGGVAQGKGQQWTITREARAPVPPRPLPAVLDGFC